MSGPCAVGCNPQRRGNDDVSLLAWPMRAALHSLICQCLCIHVAVDDSLATWFFSGMF